MAEYIDRTQLALTAIDITDLPEDKALLVYEKEEVEGLPTADVIERSKIDNAIKEMNSMPLGLVMDCDEMRDYCVEILKRNIGE